MEQAVIESQNISSYLNHKVEQQKVDKERIMVAFNYGF